MNQKITALLIIGFATTLSITGWSQATDPQYRQFFFNPYLHNSAFVGLNDRPEVSMVYKKQWVNFRDAPTALGVSLQLPTSERVILGLNIVSESQFLLKNTSFTGTFGYVVPIDRKQSLRFGLSAGAGVKKLQFTAEELNTNDPAIINAAENNHYLNGDFGLVYTYNKLKIGMALTQLFNSDPYEQEQFNKFSLSNLRNRLFSVSYTLSLDPFENFSLEPYALYHQSANGLSDYWEAASIFHYRKDLWAGLSYHEDRGLGLFVGLNHKEAFSFSYAYEFPPFRAGGIPHSSHELQMKLTFGKKTDRNQSFDRRK